MGGLASKEFELVEQIELVETALLGEQFEPVGYLNCENNLNWEGNFSRVQAVLSGVDYSFTLIPKTYCADCR